MKIDPCEKCNKYKGWYFVVMGDHNPQNEEELNLCTNCLLKEFNYGRLDIIQIINNTWDVAS